MLSKKWIDLSLIRDEVGKASGSRLPEILRSLNLISWTATA